MALTSNGVGTCGPDDNQAQAGHLVPTLTAAMGSNVGHPGDAGKDEMVLSLLAETLRVYPLAVRGRDNGSELEIGPEGGPYNALRAGDGGSSQSALVAITAQAETAVRRLTPLECERLQGFPDGWTETSNGKPQADYARYRQMGNSVAVPCLEWIIGRLVAVDEELFGGAL